MGRSMASVPGFAFLPAQLPRTTNDVFIVDGNKAGGFKNIEQPWYTIDIFVLPED